MRHTKGNSLAAVVGRQGSSGGARCKAECIALGSRTDLFAYANAVAAAIPELPGYLRTSTIRYLLTVLHAALAQGRAS